MNYYAKTNIGRVREKNQDQAIVCVNTKNQVLAVVCDGMGGHKAGEIASRVVMDHVVGCFKVNPPFISEEEVVHWLKDTIQQSDTIVKKMAHASEEQEGMGTTIVIAVVMENEVYISHVGDSRAYLLQGETIRQITKDHTLVNALIEQGAISEEEAKHHSQKNVLLQAIGAEAKLEPSLYKEVFNDAKLLLCSDGLYNTISDDVMLELCSQDISVVRKAEALIDAANENGGHDNIAVAIVETQGGK